MPRRRSHGFLKQTFDARDFPSAIWINEDCIPGPFCVHCGNPWVQHGDGNHCPDVKLHPLYPNGKLPLAAKA